MFEAAEVGNKIDKDVYEREAPRLRAALLEAQQGFAASDFSVALIVGGVEGAGKAETVNLLHEWMDARGIQTHAFWEPTDEERERPPMWRFWRVLPPRGRMGIYFGSWYTRPIIDRVFGRTDDPELERSLARVVEFERMLHNEGVLVLKLWMHLSRKAQKRRLKALEKDPIQSWRVTPLDWKFFKKYERFREVSEQALRRTSTAEAPWHVVEATDERFRNLTVATTLLDTLRRGLEEASLRSARPRPRPDRPAPNPVNILSRLDLGLELSDKDAKSRLLKLQGRLNLVTRRLYEQRRGMLLVFEGPDAAGKGGAIRRLTQAMDSRNYQVISVAAPTDEERARPYLWRFWRNLPRLGRVTIFDRSWYGRVLVERLEGFCYEADWQRAYGEINAFEDELTEFGIILVKFWLQLSPREQFRRFKERERTPYKQYKLTEEDWRNRKKWAAYEAAACEALERTSTPRAPWVLVEAENKEWARVKVVRTVVKRLEGVLGR